MTVRHTFVLMLAALAFAARLPASAQAAPGSPQNVLLPLTNGYFAALADADGRALATRTTSTFHVILPDGKRISADEFFRRLSEHYLIASAPVGTVKIGPSTISDTNATETVETSSWDYAMLGGPQGPVLERDYATHQLTWIKSADGTWLLDEDRLTSAVHTP